VTKNLLINERLMSEFLDFKNDAAIVGIEVHENGKKIGRLFGYIPGLELYILNEDSNTVDVISIGSGAADELTFTSSTAHKYFPAFDKTFATARPYPANHKKIKQSPLYGSQIWTGEE